MDHGILATWLLLAILALGEVSAERSSSSCMPGMKTPGITSPSGDIILEEGNPLEINCTIYPSHNQAQGRNASDLAFYLGGKEVPSKYITIANETTINLRIDHLPLNNYLYYCKLRQPHEKQPIAVCLNQVTVGRKPQEVQNFTCVSHNWQSLTCHWAIAENPLKTTYQIFFNLPGRAGRRSNATCPLDTDIKINECTWGQNTTPIYRQPYEYYFFALTGKNELGVVSFQSIKFHHYAHVIPSEPVNLQVHNITTNSMYLTWGVPFPLTNFPPGLLHRVEYRSEWDPADKWEIADTSLLNKIEKNLTFHLTGLKYAYTHYTIRVLMKSKSAAGDGAWSSPSIVTRRTAATIPGISPKTDIGSFEILGGMPRRDVYIYWQQIPKYLQNGENFEYRITQVEETGETKILTPNETTLSYAKIKALSYNSYKFIIRAHNHVGSSENPSIITIPSHTASLPEPLSFTKIAFGSGVYELSWRRPPHFKNIQNYTIFWCDNERDRPYQCTGFLNWTHVPHDVYIKNITVPDDKIYQFAISANTANSSSGLLWATCTVIHNKGIGKMKNVWVNKVGSTFIEVGWKLECSDRIGLVMGYRIYYCPIVSPVNRTCRDPLKNTTVPGDSLNIHGNITDLMPYTTYMVGISVMSRGGEGLQSDPQLATTLEAAPEPPSNVKITELTNTSMIVSWSPPRLMNGVLQYYEVHFNKESTRVEGSTNVKLLNLTSYTNHTVYVTACTGSCSDGSESVTVQTTVGNPSMVERLMVRRMNVSQFLVTWQPPATRSGELGYYEIAVQQVDGTNRSLTHLFNTTGTEYIVPVVDCSSDDNRRTYVFAVRAVNIDQHNETFLGRWSEPQERDNCFDSGFSQQSVIIWSCSIILAAIFGLCIWLYGKKCWKVCKDMRNVEVKLPPGLDPPRDNDHLNMSSCVALPRQSDSSKHQTADLEDSKHLLAKNERHGRNPSGDSSGCSSGHDSVSSSLTSNTQISTDSGAEVDQLNTLSESAFADGSHIQTRDGDSQWGGECYSNLRRSARSTPNLSTDSDTRPDTPRYTCLSSCPSTGHLSSRTEHIPLATSSSSLYCKIGSNDTTPTHSPSYCCVGVNATPAGVAMAAQASAEQRSQVPITPANKGYITHARVAEVIRPSAPAASVPSASGYVAHPPLWNNPNKEITLAVSSPVALVPATISAQPQRSLPFTRTEENSKDRPANQTNHLESIPEHSDSYSRVGWPQRHPTAGNSNSASGSVLSGSDTPVKTRGYVQLGVDPSPPKAAVVSVSPPLSSTPSGYVMIQTDQWPCDSSNIARDNLIMTRPVQQPTVSPSPPTLSPTSSNSSPMSSSTSGYVPHRQMEKCDNSKSDVTSRQNNVPSPDGYTRVSSVVPSTDSDNGSNSNNNGSSGTTTATTSSNSSGNSNSSSSSSSNNNNNNSTTPTAPM